MLGAAPVPRYITNTCQAYDVPAIEITTQLGYERLREDFARLQAGGDSIPKDETRGSSAPLSRQECSYTATLTIINDPACNVHRQRG